MLAGRWGISNSSVGAHPPFTFLTCYHETMPSAFSGTRMALGLGAVPS